MTMKKSKKVWSLLLVLSLVIGMAAGGGQSQAYSVPSNMKWWTKDRFGMFIHFGAYSYYGHGEWAMQTEGISKQKYQQTVAAKFNPTKFNANEIVKYAKLAGMKYIVITAKHHEGMAMWDTNVASFKDYTGKTMFSLQQYTPFGKTGRDVLMELKTACDKAGIKFGLYYSIIDWNHSSQTINGDFTKMKSMAARTAYIRDMKAQLKELVDRYDPAIMWFDGDWTYRRKAPTLAKWWTKADGKDLYKYVKSLKSSILVNERVCRGFKLGDFECPERSIPEKAPSRPWETCQSMNDAWGYKKDLENSYRSYKYLIRELVDVASKSGNYLLNIGPKGDGTMTAGSKKALRGIGNWMKKNGSSIYATSGNPFGKVPSWGTYTKKGKNVYVHVTKWPKNKKLTVRKYKNKKLKKVYLLESGKKISCKGNKKGKTKVTLKVTKKVPNKKDTVIVMQYK